ncbi:radical SAM/SPASM domain-containing protein [Paenibacillus sp. FSL L8-0689]|uniref:radical SAM/SPASM domain-containing protein n=1 Tax=Paenibacillus sp. FSL L8-0689 TaxID=2921607 RepID=UPI0030F9342A
MDLCKVNFGDFSELFNYIQEYKKAKPAKTAFSIGKIFSEHNFYYFYDSGTSKVVMVDSNIAQLIELLISSNKSLDELNRFIYSHNIDVDELMTSINEEDLFKGFNIKHLYNDISLEYMKNQMNMGTTQLILELTGKCNMRCRYCVYHDGYPHNRTFTSKRMSSETALKSIDFMKLYGDQQEVSITFYGGEPLLEFKLLKEVIEYSKIALAGRTINFSFTTNLSVLTPKMAEYFSTVDNLSILCSIDGPKEMHDMYRVYKNGSGSFDDVFEKFKLLNSVAKKNGKDMHIAANAVYMPPFSVEKISQIDDFFTNLDFTHEDFQYQLGYAGAGTVPEELLKNSDFNDQSLRQWQDKQIDITNNLEEFKEQSIFSLLDRIHKRSVTKRATNFVPMNSCCVVGSRRLFVSTDGNFFPCERIGNSPSIGNVNQGIIEEKIYNKYVYEFSEAWENICSDCWAAKLCSSCYVNKMDSSGVREPDLAECEYYRSTAERSLRNYHNLLRTSPEKLAIFNEDVALL